MDRNLSKLAGAALVATLLGAACKGDPTTGLVGGVSTVTTSVSYLTVNIGDSALVQATVRDAANQPVEVPATAASNATSIVDVSAGPATPVPATQFYVKGIAYGTGVITVTAGTATATINVKTYPAFVAITGSRDSVLSGGTRQLSVTPQDQSLAAITVVDTFTWSSNNTAVLSVDQTGLITAKAPGIATITLTGPGSPNKVSTTAQFSVVPGVFGGTVSSTTPVAGQIVTFTKAAGDPNYSATMTATVDGVSTYVTAATTNSIGVVIPPLGKTATVRVVLAGIGPNSIAQAKNVSVTSAYDDPATPGDEAPGTAPVITANGEYFAVLHGTCAAAGGGSPSAPSDRCDKFWKVTNGTGASITLQLQADWSGGTASDVDLITCNSACSGSFGFAGATGANPEKTSVTIAAGVTRVIWINNFAPASLAILVRMTVISGLP